MLPRPNRLPEPEEQRPWWPNLPAKVRAPGRATSEPQREQAGMGYWCPHWEEGASAASRYPARSGTPGRAAPGPLEAAAEEKAREPAALPGRFLDLLP